MSEFPARGYKPSAEAIRKSQVALNPAGEQERVLNAATEGHHEAAVAGLEEEEFPPFQYAVLRALLAIEGRLNEITYRLAALEPDA